MTFHRGDILTLRDGTRAVVQRLRGVRIVADTEQGVTRIVTPREVVGKYGSAREG